MPIGKLYLFILAFASFAVSAQDCLTPTAQQLIYGNNIRANLLNGGDLFWDGSKAKFMVPFNIQDDAPRSSIFNASLWLGGLDEGGQLHLAAQTYGRAYEAYDYAPGPLNHITGEPYYGFCDLFDRIWTIQRVEIEAHISDWEDNGQIDHPISGILSWPGNGNPHSLWNNGVPIPATDQGWAPFFDHNNNGIYDPLNGDYPHPAQLIPPLHPEMMTWTVFNDLRPHSQSYGIPLKFEIQQTFWINQCSNQYILNNTLFSSIKIINRANEHYDSLRLGLRTDFDLGCFEDDYIGCYPDGNSFFAYNEDNADGYPEISCSGGVSTYGYNPPAQSVTFLNIEMDNFTYHHNGSIGLEAYFIEGPSSPNEYYYFLKGLRRDGLPFRYGEIGYNPDSIPTKFVFPGNPNNPDEWSLYQSEASFGDRRNIGSVLLDNMAPSETKTVDLAFTFHRWPGYNHLENVDRMYYNINYLQQMYDQQFNNYCNEIFSPQNDIASQINIEVFPIPTNDLLQVTIDKVVNRSKFFLITLQGHQVEVPILKIASNKFQLDVSSLQSGAYFLKIQTDNGLFVRKIMKL